MTLAQYHRIKLVSIYLGALLVLLLMAFPLYGVLLTSIQPEAVIRSPNVQFIPRTIIFDHYAEIFAPGHIVPIREAMGNSLFLALLSAGATVLVALPATYALTRLRLPGQRLILGALASVYFLPTLLFIVPIYILAVRIGLTDSFVGLLIPYMAFTLPLTIWALKGFIEAIPHEIEEAARIDGCSQLQLIVRIVLPLLRPALLAALLMVFILAWIEFLTPLLFTNQLEILTVSLGLYRSTFDIEIGQLAAAAVVTAFPVLLLTAVFQRLITQVVTAGSDR